MPSTYTPIASTTANGGETAITFTSISATYTDIVAILNVWSTASTGNSGSFIVNGDSGSNYGITYAYGNGSTAASGRNTNFTRGIIGYFVTPGPAASFPCVVNFQNYSNTTTFKTVVYRANYPTTTSSYPGAEMGVNVWRNTNAINSISFGLDGGAFAAGSMITLYGIKAA